MSWIELNIHTRDQVLEGMNIEGGYDEVRCCVRSEIVEGIMDNAQETKGGCYVFFAGEWLWCAQSYDDIKAVLDDSYQDEV